MDVLTIAVHPDDETLGCGGTLLKHKAAGDRLHWLLVTAARPPLYDDRAIEQQRRQVEAVRGAYPFESFTWLEQPTTRLDTLSLEELIRPIRETITRLRPEVVYLPNRTDAHSDHRITFLAANAVLKSFYLKKLGVRRVLMCETPSETEAAPALPEAAFLPQVSVDVSGTLERKLEIFSLYASETQPGFLPRSPSAIEALARWRGAAVGVEYAESFMLLRELA
jgi:LmbE family N-acetylglucosaminyl deacetylase